MKYEILKREDNLLEIRYHAPDLYGGITKMQMRIMLDGDCYYVALQRFTFSEVFCKVK
jgi:hypothetical protein